MRPLALPDGHDFPRLVDELVPGLAAEGDDIVVMPPDQLPACFKGVCSPRRILIGVIAIDAFMF